MEEYDGQDLDETAVTSDPGAGDEVSDDENDASSYESTASRLTPDGQEELHQVVEERHRADESDNAVDRYLEPAAAARYEGGAASSLAVPGNPFHHLYRTSVGHASRLWQSSNTSVKGTTDGRQSPGENIVSLHSESFDQELQSSSVCANASAASGVPDQPIGAAMVSRSLSSSAEHLDTVLNACDARPTRIAVSGFENSARNQRRIRDYFQSLFGVDAYKDSTWHGDNVLIVTFSSCRVVDDVLSLPHPTLHSTQLSITALEPDLDERQIPRRAFFVSKNRRNNDTGCVLHNFLDDLRITGSRMEYVQDMSRYVVTLKSAEDMRLVTERQRNDGTIQFEDQTFRIELMMPVRYTAWTPGQLEPETFLVHHLPCNGTDDKLKQYLQKGSGVRIKSVTNLTNPRRAVVEFRTNVDYNKLRSWVYQEPYVGEMLSIQRVAVTSTIRVNKPANIAESNEHWREDLMYHFKRFSRQTAECEHRQGSREDVHVEIVGNCVDSSSYALVKFHCRHVLDKMRSCRNWNKIIDSDHEDGDGEVLDISLYHDVPLSPV